MPDTFTNQRAYYDVAFPSSGDGYDISKNRNAFMGLGFMDFIPLQPRAHNVPDMKIMIRGRDASSYYNPVYYGDANQRIPFSSGDTASFSSPVSNPRIDIVYLTPSGDIKIQQGTEAASPTLPSLSPSGDSRTPVCAVYLRPGMTKIVAFENKNSSTGDGYIYQDLRPWLRTAGAGSTSLGSSLPVSPTGDAQASAGSLTTAAKSDHVHGGVYGVRKVGSTNIQGQVEFAGGISQASNRITVLGKLVQTARTQDGTMVTATPAAIPNDNTRPTTSEGMAYSQLTTSITPLSVSNILVVRGTISLNVNAAGPDIIMTLFKDAETNARMVKANDAGGNNFVTIPYEYILNPVGTVSSVSFSVRVGDTAGSQITVNGQAGVQKFDGAMMSTMIIEEFEPG